MQARRPSGREARERQDPSPSGKRHLLPVLLPEETRCFENGDQAPWGRRDKLSPSRRFQEHHRVRTAAGPTQRHGALGVSPAMRQGRGAGAGLAGGTDDNRDETLCSDQVREEEQWRTETTQAESKR